MDPNNNNRNNMNYGYDRNYNANNRAYPTTPSAFPQPIYQTQGAQEYVDPSNPAYAPGYFMPNNYPAQQVQPQYVQQQQQQQQQQYAQQQALQSPQPAYQARPGYPDGTNGLIQQFSNQDLNANRAGFFNNRAGSPAQRPRTAGGSPAQTQAQASHLIPPVPRSPRPPPENEELQRFPDRYSENAHKRGKAAKELVTVFFHENIERARDRNMRSAELDKTIREPTIPIEKKRQDADLISKRESDFLRFLRTKETPANFQTIKIIGKGAFGEVKLVQRKTDGKIYALKSLIKTEMFKKDQLAHVRAERDILADSKDNPWLVKLHASFQDAAYLYLLMEFLPGGDLMTMLIKYEIFSEDITRFYMAEVVMAIEANSTSKDRNRNSGYFNDAINLTVSNRGQINTWRKSRRAMAYSTVGTPDYIAPEIFNGQGYTYLCDWWSVGAIMFECLVGWPPFCAEDTNDTYRKIVNWRECLYFPDELVLGRDSEALIRSFLCDPDHRIGSEGGQHGGATQIKNHPFFRGVVWDQLRGIRAPFEPRLSSNIDVSYFPIDEIPQEDTSAIHRAQARAMPDSQEAEMSLPFIGYTYKAFNAFQTT
ncbi:hypothetical protein HAV15_002860 [Penicillium sp. str. |nr:hypothetical protein HAV15_002860 [Penicillium sp. str. \